MRPELQYVEAEVLNVNTPLDVCRLAAGEHQLSQRDVQSMTVHEIFAMMAQASKEKSLTAAGTPYLTDNEIHKVCVQCGLQKLRDRNGKELTPEHEFC